MLNYDININNSRDVYISNELVEPNLRLNFYSYTIFFAGVEDYDHRESYLTINFTNKTIDSLTLNSSDDKYFTVVASNNLPHLILVREFNIPPSVRNKNFISKICSVFDNCSLI